MPSLSPSTASALCVGAVTATFRLPFSAASSSATTVVLPTPAKPDSVAMPCGVWPLANSSRVSSASICDAIACRPCEVAATASALFLVALLLAVLLTLSKTLASFTDVLLFEVLTMC